ncbi:MAG: alginate lyase family protein [Anaerorhabdus sp.]|uniref:alginate lyase family protein n=1 Tax=Anaerorhabdus sp. TaxID=1872524 RepID=UPI003A8C393C
MNKLEKIIEYLQIDKMNVYFDDEIENKKVIDYANQICENIFSFTKPWDMERCSKPLKLSKKINWNEIVNDDEEWTFMLNRMSYLRDLIIAYILTKEEKYSVKCRGLILEWIEDHHDIEYSLSTRTLDTAIRIENIFEVCIFLDYFGKLSQDDEEIITESIIKQMKYLKDNYIMKYRLSNWGSIQTSILLALSPYFSMEKNDIELWANQELIEQLKIQVNKKGMHWEQSTMYHVEVLNSLFKLVQYRQYLDIPCDEALITVIIEMTAALFQLTYPNGYMENFGDSDRTCTDDIFVKAIAILKMNRWKTKVYKKDYETILTLGSKTINDYEKLGMNKDFSLNFIDEDTGIYLLKKGCENDFSSTMFVNGTLGSGHGHCDNLHISLCYNGEFILIDSGRYTYREDHELRPYLKSMKAHNTVIIDDNPHSVPEGSWSIKEFCKPLKNYESSVHEIHYLEGCLVASKQGLFHQRRIVTIDCGIWMILDEVNILGNHTSTSYFHFDPEIKVNLKDKDIEILSKKNKLKMIYSGDAKIINEFMSLNYNELSNQDIILIENEFQDHEILPTIIIDERIKIEEVEVIQGESIVKDDNLFIARKFKVSSTLSYTVILFHKEVFKGQKIFKSEGCSFHGQAIVIKEENGNKNLFVLRH